MQITSTRRPEFRQLALGQQPASPVQAKSSAPATVGLAGAMFCVGDPPPWLASRAQQALGAAQLPRDLLLGVPADQAFSHLARPRSELSDDKVEALGETSVRALKYVSNLMADQPQMPGWVGTGVRVGWVVYGATRLMHRWRDGADWPTLTIGVTELALDAVKAGQKADVLPDTGWLAPSVLEDVGVALVATEAAFDGDDVAMALLDKQLARTHELYEAAKVFEPVLGACLSSDPAFAGYELYPFPHRPSAPLGTLSTARPATGLSIGLDQERNERSTDGR